MTIVLGDFNAKSSWWKAGITSCNWWKADITSFEGSIIDTIASSYGLNQLTSQMHWPNFHFTTKFSHGIWNLFIVAFKLSPSHSFCKFDLSIFYAAPYCLVLWRAITELIRRAIDQFDWLRALSNVNVDEKVYFFTKTLLNIIQNFIPHETIICDDRDPP